MIDYESLLEFEECLRLTSTRDNSLTLTNLEQKIEFNRIREEDDGDWSEFTEEDLNSAILAYDATKDEFTVCSNCGIQLDELLEKKCCKSFITNNHLSNLEKSYWLSFMNNPSRTINTLPNYTEMLFLQQGIPHQIRSIIWKKIFLMNNRKVPETSILVLKNFQHSYNQEISKQISKDLNRTFPTVKFFKKQETIDLLSTILNVFANFDVELGYCQGLLFLVGTLFYQFQSDSDLTFHALISIMEIEAELHDIFTPKTMSSMLQKWCDEFMSILESIDKELYLHLKETVEVNAFLHQWWLSFMSSHTPDTSLVNRIMDFCIIQGWKMGMFKISLGLLITNKPILMTLEKEDDGVIYQHLLYESKWGVVVKDLDSFFTSILKWDDSIFASIKSFYEPVPKERSYEAMFGSFKNLSLSKSRNRSNSDTSQKISNSNNFSMSSLFSNKPSSELDSIYSDISDSSESKSFTDYLKISSITRKRGSYVSEGDQIAALNSQLLEENQKLRLLLDKAKSLLRDNGIDAKEIEYVSNTCIDI